MRQISNDSKPILFFTTELDGITRYNGGVGIRYRSLIESLAELTFRQVHVFVLAPQKNLESEKKGIQGATIEVLRFPDDLPGVVLAMLRPLRVVLRIARFRAGCIAVAPEWEGLLAFAHVFRKATLVSNLVTGLRVADSLIANHGMQQKVSRTPMRRVQYFLERKQVETSTLAISCSTALADRSADYFELPTTVVVRNSIDPQRAKRRIESIRSTTTPSILFLGRSEERKGIDTALRAIANVRSAGYDLNFRVVGGDPELAWNQDGRLTALAAELDLRSSLSYEGAASPSDTIAIMREADVCIFPSRWEAFGNVALEAWAAGTPVVATRGSGFDDFLVDRENSLLCDPDDAEQLADQIMELLDSSLLAAQLVEAGSAALASFTASAVARDFLRVLDETDSS